MVSGAFVQSYIHGGPSAADQPAWTDTQIGAGATAPGGWLRVAKEGGKHLLWSAEYTGAGRLAPVQRRRLHGAAEPARAEGVDRLADARAGHYTVETTSAFEVTENRNLSGLDLGQLYELNGRLKLRNFSSILLAADFAPARFDDREVGNGTALERARYLGGRLELASDPRGRFYATLANQTQFIGAGTYATSAQGSLLVHALRQLDIELLPAAHLVGGRVSLRAPGRRRATELLLRQADGQQRERDASARPTRSRRS